jgi:hypothetical protein
MSKPIPRGNGHAADLEQAAATAELNVTPNGMLHGQTLHDLTAEWWRWIANAPADTNPILDETGDWAGVDNDGSVFFLAGSFGGEVTRDITVEAGVPILVPILNNLTFQWVGPGEKGVAQQGQAEWHKSVSDLFLEIDGVAVRNLQADLVRTPWFGGAIEEGGLFDAFGLSGDMASANSIGYWSVIDGLSSGNHTLHFGGTAGSFSTDVTVNLIVV